MADTFNPESEYTCRICLEEGQRVDFIAPCACSGSSRWVHRSCLDKWRSTREDKAFSRCTECLQSYDLICISNDSFHDACVRRTRFFFYVSRDLIASLVCTQLCIFLFAAITYAFDYRSNQLINTFHMQNHLYLFYYLAGLFISLSLLGMIATCFRNQLCGSCGDSCDLHCHDPIVICPYSAPEAHCCTCYCGECTCCAEGCHIGTCECGECCSAGMGEEALVLILIVFVVFAVIGVFVSVFIGTLMIQNIIRKHIHILNKFNLTKEYIVKDLAPGALPIHLNSPSPAYQTNSSDSFEDIEMTLHGNQITNPFFGDQNSVQYTVLSSEPQDIEMIRFPEQDILINSSAPPSNLDNNSLPSPLLNHLSNRQRQELSRLGLV